VLKLRSKRRFLYNELEVVAGLSGNIADLHFLCVHGVGAEIVEEEEY